jgi:drug/metabolite transporter, DME family
LIGQHFKSPATSAHLARFRMAGMNTSVSSSFTRGVLLVLSAAALWGTTGTAQSLAPMSLSSYWVGCLRLLAAALFFLPGLWRARHLRLAPTSSGAPQRWPIGLILAAAACMCGYNLAFFAGVRLSGVATGTAVALGSGPIWAGVLPWLWQRQRLGAAWWLGTTVAVGGVALMLAGPAAAGHVPSALGLSLCLLAGLAYASYALINKRLVALLPAGPLTGAVFVAAALMAIPLAFALAGVPTVPVQVWAVIAWLGVMSTGVAYLMFSHSLHHISSATAVALALAEPVVAFVLALLVVGERPGGLGVLGLALIVAGLAGVVRAEQTAHWG